MKLLGIVKTVQLKSKVEPDGDTVHNVQIGFELKEGLDNVQDIVELLKQYVSIEINDKQPTLLGKGKG